MNNLPIRRCGGRHSAISCEACMRVHALETENALLIRERDQALMYGNCQVCTRADLRGENKCRYAVGPCSCSACILAGRARLIGDKFD